MIVVTAEEMRALDRWTIAHGTPGPVLMERAGEGAARVLRAAWPRPGGPVVVCCGKGNNGGDGFVLARHLRRARLGVEVWLVGRPDDVRGDAAEMLARWRGAVTTVECAGAARRRCASASVTPGWSSMRCSAPGSTRRWAARWRRSSRPSTPPGGPSSPSTSPSGLSADTGRPLGVAVRANVTATFAFPKVGQVIHPGPELCGRLEVVDIGIPPEALAAVPPTMRLLDAAEVGRLLPRRPRDAHKGTFGHVLVVAGSRGKIGAALLAAEGGGPHRRRPDDAGDRRGVCCRAWRDGCARLMTEPLPDGPTGTVALGDGTALDRLLAARDAVVCGPGLGQAPEARDAGGASCSGP